MSLTDMKNIKDFYFLISNTLILFSILVLGVHIFLATHYGNKAIDYVAKLSPVAREEYKHLTDDQVNELLNATWNLPGGGWEYEEWVGFKEAERKSKFINVNSYGVRSNKQEVFDMNSINDAIWMFGGSTTFGYGVADAETIPAIIEKTTNNRVINFGRAYFYSAQENTFLTKILEAGYKPKKVIFLDGINERCDIDSYQAEMKILFRNSQKAYNWTLGDVIGPINFGLAKILAKLGKHSPQNNSKLHDLKCTSFGAEQSLEVIHLNNLIQRKALCSQYNLDCKTFVQPFAGVHGIHNDYDMLKQEVRDKLYTKYQLMQDNWRKFGAIFVTDSLDKRNSHSFIDDVHYSVEANKLIAISISKHIEQVPDSIIR